MVVIEYSNTESISLNVRIDQYNGTIGKCKEFQEDLRIIDGHKLVDSFLSISAGSGFCHGPGLTVRSMAGNQPVYISFTNSAKNNGQISSQNDAKLADNFENSLRGSYPNNNQVLSIYLSLYVIC
ncbi:hypothetical protein GOODEAATRI_012388 [Goodea atripinnis]|uniref:Uncharacterized protein n=1 Tax=Goodea atripinnis TaxID=208336 RepID=A0ABV0N0T6_9TELE